MYLRPIRAAGIIVLSLLSAAAVLLCSWLPKGGVYPFVSRRIWGPGLVKLAGARVTVSGLEHLKGCDACIVYANHSSHFDIPAMCAVLPIPLYFIAKRELRRIPIFGWGMWAIGMIFVDRSDPEKARTSLAKAAKAIRRGKHVVTFPEGTRSVDGRLQAFKKGTFHLAKADAIPLVPVAIAGSNRVLPPGGKLNKGHIHVRVGEPIGSTLVASLSANELAAESHRRMASLLAELEAERLAK